jgi:very-short-patch-repair endonuclease
LAVGVKTINGDYGLLTERKVLDELKKRNLPCQQRVHIGDLEIDILVGERLCVEVDGYYHALKGKISRDASKQKHLEARGYVILRITGADAKDRRKLRQFADRVATAYGEEQSRQNSNKDAALTKTISGEGLAQLKAHLEREEEIQKQRKKQKKEAAIPKKLTDKELFLQAVNDLSKRGRK